nr:unnamed protein product [Haemonchus contortus]
MTLWLLFVVLCLPFYRSSLAYECYVGKNAAVAVTVVEPYCGFRITYENDTCESNADVDLTLEYQPSVHVDDQQLKDLYQGGVCYFYNFSLSCICYGHLCNNATHVKEILAFELAREALSPVEMLITCFLHRDEISAVFGSQTTNNPTTTTVQQTPPTDALEVESQEIVENKEEIIKEESRSNLILYIIVAVIALLLILTSAIFFILAIMNISKRSKVMKSMKAQTKAESSAKDEKTKEQKSSPPTAQVNPESSKVSGEADPTPLASDPSKSNRDPSNKSNRDPTNTSERPQNSASRPSSTNRKAPDLYASFDSTNTWDKD